MFFFQFSYSTPLDYVLIFLGTAASVLHGAGFPLLSIVLGGMTSGKFFFGNQLLIKQNSSVFLRAENSEFAHGETPRQPANASSGNAAIPPISQEEFQKDVIIYSVLYLVLGAIMFITSYVQVGEWEGVEQIQFYFPDRLLGSSRRTSCTSTAAKLFEGSAPTRHPLVRHNVHRQFDRPTFG